MSNRKYKQGNGSENKTPGLEVLSKAEHKEILFYLKEQFGIEELPGVLVRRGKERIFLFQGNLMIRQIRKLEKNVFIERAGAYIGKLVEYSDVPGKKEMRLSIEGSQIFKEQIKENIVELDSKEVEKWMSGRELLIKTDEDKKGFVIIKSKETGYFLGCGKASKEKISNYIPKNRRLKDKNIQ